MTTPTTEGAGMVSYPWARVAGLGRQTTARGEREGSRRVLTPPHSPPNRVNSEPTPSGSSGDLSGLPYAPHPLPPPGSFPLGSAIRRTRPFV
ncbi:hypothetical protein E2C01_009934 [Portunus trituberculatus]|uniref:Uncharacterized protein n=1 Tax=Portunus trituberculatus TaxID=210409 RepID=A0A5B7D722_PORTR|nr:hypothetical protein [Portunus trituberculatus]